jgi:hypothetical protein
VNIFIFLIVDTLIIDENKEEASLTADFGWEITLNLENITWRDIFKPCRLGSHGSGVQ